MFYNGSKIKIDLAYCLYHPEKRADAKERITSNAQNVGLNIDFLKFFTIGTDHQEVYGLPPSNNCALCHRKMIEYCIANDYTNVLFLEDDSVFTNDFVQVLENITDVPEEYHQLTLGGYCRDEAIEMVHEVPYDTEGYKNPRFVKVRFSWGLFGSIIHKRSFPLMLNNGIHNLMDVAVRDCIENPNVYILHYPVIVEKAGKSAINGEDQPRQLYHQCVKEGRINE